MKNLTEQQLLDNYQKLLDVVEEHFNGERKEKILKMYDFFKERIIVAPASGKPNYHYCSQVVMQSMYYTSYKLLKN